MKVFGKKNIIMNNRNSVNNGHTADNVHVPGNSFAAGEFIPAPHPHIHPVPPHERGNMVTINFDEQDSLILQRSFGDEDSAMASARIIYNAPPEIRIVAAQLLELISKSSCLESDDSIPSLNNIFKSLPELHREEACLEDESSPSQHAVTDLNHACRTRWASPVLGHDIKTLYRGIYGNDGDTFLNVLETSPYEISVISALLTYLTAINIMNDNCSGLPSESRQNKKTCDSTTDSKMDSAKGGN